MYQGALQPRFAAELRVQGPQNSGSVPSKLLQPEIRGDARAKFLQSIALLDPLVPEYSNDGGHEFIRAGTGHDVLAVALW